jgi:hypothetical protein
LFNRVPFKSSANASSGKKSSVHSTTIISAGTIWFLKISDTVHHLKIV